MSTSGTGTTSLSQGRHEYARFPDSYRQRWVESGHWKDLTLHEFFDETVADHPDMVAISTKDRSIDFTEWKALSDALAAGLLGIGIGPGDLVGVQLPNWPEFCFLQIALSRVGAVIQPVHLVFREREMRSLYGFCDTDAVIVPESFRDYDYAEVMRKLRGDLPCLQKLIIARGSAKGEGEHVLEELIEEGRQNLDRLESVEPDPDAPFYLNFTSGTEGNPKGFLHTHNTLVALFKTAAELMAKMNPDMVNLACSPMTHTYGHVTTYQCAMGPIPMVLVDRYNPGDVLELIQAKKVTALSGTPAHIIGLFNHPDFEKYDTSSVKTVGLGGAQSSPELIEKVQKTWGASSASGNTYGMGENIMHTRTLPFDPEDKIRNTVGRPMLGAELKIVDQNDRTRELGPNELGEIAFRGPTLFVAYHKQPELTRETRDDEGWFYTSDLGFVDEDGYLVYVGRAKEVINRGGTKIYPKEIEDLLSGHPDIEQVAVVRWPDERMGELVCAYVVGEGGAQLTVEDLAAYLSEQKAMKYLTPEHVINVDEFPMTPTGKVQKVALQEDALKRAEEAKRK
jgi:acyl-CoA synthetase (AMP-forming)/AMP-acid ligase II